MRTLSKRRRRWGGSSQKRWRYRPPAPLRSTSRLAVAEQIELSGFVAQGLSGCSDLSWDCGREARECGQAVGNAAALSTGCPHGPQGSEDRAADQGTIELVGELARWNTARRHPTRADGPEPESANALEAHAVVASDGALVVLHRMSASPGPMKDTNAVRDRPPAPRTPRTPRGSAR